jgi:nucleoside phosphorylase
MSIRSHRDYTIGWICALPLEAAASVAMLDEQHERLDNPLWDHNTYFLGRVGKHNVAIACLGRTGTNSAAVAASHMQSTFTNIRCGLLVGIGGGCPSVENDIRFGDVVISKPSTGNGGVIQYDFGKTVKEGRFIPSAAAMTPPPPILINAIAALETQHIVSGNRLRYYLSDMKSLVRGDYQYQGAENDILFQAGYKHVGNDTCKSCDRKMSVVRTVRKSQDPYIHYGVIASGNQVMKDGIMRDKLREYYLREYHGSDILCFEMEAAGLMDYFPCVVIRGISDYADTHKNDRWKQYAAATAAAYAKELLSIITPELDPVHRPGAGM